MMLTKFNLYGLVLLQAAACFPTDVAGQVGNGPGRLVVFGDSFSDNGNGSWIASNMSWPADPAYAGHHFSNGPVWAQYFAEEKGWELFDLAAGGATADNSFVAGFTGYKSDIPVPSTSDQITTFLTSNSVQPSDVFALFVGANDILFNASITGQQIATIIEGQVHRLYNAGANTILLADYPRLDTLPAEESAEVSTKEALVSYTADLRQTLDLVATSWSPYMHITVVDVGNLFQSIFTDPTRYGIDPAYVNPSVACLVGAYPGEGPRTLCSDPDQHIFFDTYHPNTRVHKLIAGVFADAFQMLPRRNTSGR